MRLRSRTLTAGIAALLIGIAPVAHPADQTATRAALQPMLDQLRAELELTDEQVERGEQILRKQIERAGTAVESFGGLSLDSVLDLLSETRTLRDDLRDDLSGLLSEEQSARLRELPAAHQVYREAMAGTVTEARLGKLATRLELTQEQLPEARAVLLDGFREAIAIVEGVARSGERPKRRSVMDAVLDLRTTQRMTFRQLEQLLTDEQKRNLEDYRDESQKASRRKWR